MTTLMISHKEIGDFMTMVKYLAVSGLFIKHARKTIENEEK